eukprot:m.70373 g.70373  ORF g.70373 m.70373 type:complete len:59 (-) comp20073_c0_seq2:440-616(-)
MLQATKRVKTLCSLQTLETVKKTTGSPISGHVENSLTLRLLGTIWRNLCLKWNGKKAH